MALQVITEFLNQIGIEIRYRPIEEETFLPGVLIDKGSLVIDREKLLYPGDLLHEAGHIAVMQPAERLSVSGNIGMHKEQQQSDGEEMMAIAWSYAALVFLKLDPSVVFHPQGYKGASDWYIEQFTSGSFIGLPTLQWIGLCYDEKNAEANHAAAYPQMIKWLRTQ